MDMIKFTKVSTSIKYMVEVSGITLVELINSDKLDSVPGLISNHEGIPLVAYDGTNRCFIITVDGDMDQTEVKRSIVNIVLDISNNR